MCASVFACVYICAVCTHPVPTESKEGCCIPWNGNCGQLKADLPVLGIEPEASRGEANALNDWAISLPPPAVHFLLKKFPPLLYKLLLEYRGAPSLRALVSSALKDT